MSLKKRLQKLEDAIGNRGGPPLTILDPEDKQALIRNYIRAAAMQYLTAGRSKDEFFNEIGPDEECSIALDAPGFTLERFAITPQELIAVMMTTGYSECVSKQLGRECAAVEFPDGLREVGQPWEIIGGP